MALWDGTSINTNETAMVFNKLANRRAVDMVRQKNGALYAILGKSEPGATPDAGMGFQRMADTTGKDIEVKLLGALATPAIITDANQTANRTVTWDQDIWGAAQMAYGHYGFVFPIPESELDRFRGDELKTVSYLEEFFNYAMLSYENVFGLALGASSSLADPAPGQRFLSSIIFAIAGNNTGAVDWATNGSAYGTINRRDSANADFRGNYTGAVGDLTLPKIRTAINQCVIRGGSPKVAITSLTPYGKVQQLVEAYTQVTYDDTWSKFGGEWCQYAGLKFTLDPYHGNTGTVGSGSGHMSIITPESWMLYKKQNTPFTSTGVARDLVLQASYVLHTTMWIQLISKAPNQNAVLAGITS